MSFFQTADTWLRKQNPWIGLSLFVLSAGLAIFLFFQSQERGLIAFANSTVLIYDQQASFDAISVVTRDGEKIEDKVFAVETVIANAGDISLSKDRERLPVTLSFGPDTNIIDARISAATDPEITNFRLIRRLQDKEQQKLELAWDHFDPDHTVRVTTIASAKDTIHPTVTGRFLGVELVKGTLEMPKTKTSRETFMILFIVIGFALSMLVVLIFLVYVMKKIFPDKTYGDRFEYAVNTLIAISVFLVISYFIYTAILRVSVPYIQ